MIAGLNYEHAFGGVDDPDEECPAPVDNDNAALAIGADDRDVIQPSRATIAAALARAERELVRGRS